MNEYSIYVALLSLLASCITIYLIQFRAPQYEIHFGERIKINYQKDGVTAGFYVPITFINTAHRTGTVLRCSMAVSRTDAPQQVFYMEWKEFRKLDISKMLWVHEDMAHPIPISGRSSVNKVCWFVWSSTPNFLFKEGSYKLRFYVWTSVATKPDITATHELFITSKVASELADYKSKKKSKTLELGFDKAIEENKLMTSHERESLLGS
jgi:hypothetical protein